MDVADILRARQQPDDDRQRIPGRQPLRLLLLLPLTLAAKCPSPAEAQTVLPALSEAQAPALPLPEPWIGDFDQMFSEGKGR